MEWDEFMQYIIDAVMENSIKGSDETGNDPSNNSTSKLSVMEMIQQMKANKFKRFYMAYHRFDKSNHNNVIAK